MILFFPLLLLASAPSPEPAQPTKAPARVAIIWGGGRDAAAAEASLERWGQEAHLIPEELTVPDGFPKLFSSATVPGLNPGFEIVVLGFCGPDEAASARRFLKLLYPFTYEKPVQVETHACPAWAVSPRDPSVSSPTTVKAKGVTLTIIEANVPYVHEPPFDYQPTQWIRVVARDKAGELRGDFSVDNTKRFVPVREVGCDTKARTQRDTVVLEHTCVEDEDTYCFQGSWKKTQVALRWNGTSLEPGKEKLLDGWSITDVARDCGE